MTDNEEHESQPREVMDRLRSNEITSSANQMLIDIHCKIQ